MRPRAARAAITLRRHLARACEAAGDQEAAIAHLRAWLDIDDADEEAHIALIRLQAACGRRTAAIAQYEACRAALLERLGARPSADCYALYRRIHADAPHPQALTHATMARISSGAHPKGAKPQATPLKMHPLEAAAQAAPPPDGGQPCRAAGRRRHCLACVPCAATG